jgi:hypothetical protein
MSRIRAPLANSISTAPGVGSPGVAPGPPTTATGENACAAGANLKVGAPARPCFDLKDRFHHIARTQRCAEISVHSALVADAPMYLLTAAGKLRAPPLHRRVIILTCPMSPDPLPVR